MPSLTTISKRTSAKGCHFCKWHILSVVENGWDSRKLLDFISSMMKDLETTHGAAMSSRLLKETDERRDLSEIRWRRSSPDFARANDHASPLWWLTKISLSRSRLSHCSSCRHHILVLDDWQLALLDVYSMGCCSVAVKWHFWDHIEFCLARTPWVSPKALFKTLTAKLIDDLS